MESVLLAVESHEHQRRGEAVAGKDARGFEHAGDAAGIIVGPRRRRPPAAVGGIVMRADDVDLLRMHGPGAHADHVVVRGAVVGERIEAGGEAEGREVVEDVILRRAVLRSVEVAALARLSIEAAEVGGVLQLAHTRHDPVNDAGPRRHRGE